MGAAPLAARTALDVYWKEWAADGPEAWERWLPRIGEIADGIGEIIGGSQREERLDYLDRRMAQFKIDPAHYLWYRDFRRYGTVPHAGFGLGFERLVVYTCGLSNIRDAIPYPRVPGSAEF